MEHLVGFTSQISSDRSPAVVDAWFRAVENGRTVYHAGFEEREEGATWTEELTEREFHDSVESGDITRIEPVDIEPVASGALLLLPMEFELRREDFRLLHEKLSVVHALPEGTTTRRPIAYATADRVRKSLYRLERHYYLEACEQIAVGHLTAAQPLVLTALRCQPASGHAILLACRIATKLGLDEIERAAPEFYRWARSADTGLSQRSDDELETIAVSLYSWEVAIRGKERPEAIGHLWEHVDKLAPQPTYLNAWQLALRTTGWKVAREPRGNPQVYWRAAVSVVERMIKANEGKPKAVDQWTLMAVLDALGERKRAMMAAKAGLQLYGEDDPNTPAAERSFYADARRIFGRHALAESTSRPAQVLAVEHLEVSRLVFGQLLATRPRPSRWLRDRLAQVELLIGIANGDQDLVRAAKERYREACRTNEATGRTWLGLVDCEIELGNFEAARSALASYANVPSMNVKLYEERKSLLLAGEKQRLLVFLLEHDDLADAAPLGRLAA